MVAVYRWGTRELVLICAAADVRQLAPGALYGRYTVVPLSRPEATLRRLLSGTAAWERDAWEGAAWEGRP